MVFSFAGLLLGGCLGLRFKAFVLVPVTLAGIPLFSLLSLIPSLNLSIMGFVASVLALNAGYLAATIIRFVVSPALGLRGLSSAPALSEPVL